MRNPPPQKLAFSLRLARHLRSCRGPAASGTPALLADVAAVGRSIDSVLPASSLSVPEAPEDAREGPGPPRLSQLRTNAMTAILKKRVFQLVDSV